MMYKHDPSKHRGATLVEVLMAIFVVGIGTLSILVLFALGMQNSAPAIAAHNRLNSYWSLHRVPESKHTATHNDPDIRKTFGLLDR